MHTSNYQTASIHTKSKQLEAGNVGQELYCKLQKSLDPKKLYRVEIRGLLETSQEDKMKWKEIVNSSQALERARTKLGSVFYSIQIIEAESGKIAFSHSMEDTSQELQKIVANKVYQGIRLH